MGKKLGRPPKKSGEAKSERVEIRLDPSERAGFQSAADLAGIELGTWMRERLRTVARAELEDAKLPIPFLKKGETLSNAAD